MLSRIYRIFIPILLILVWIGVFSDIQEEARLRFTAYTLGVVPWLMWIDTLMLSGPRSLRSIPMMGQIFMRSKRSAFIVLAVLLPLALFYPPFGTNPDPNKGIAAFFLVSAAALLWLQPPFVIVLGGSNPQTEKTISILSEGTFPLRIVAMLEFRGSRNYRLGGLGSFAPLTDNLRTSSDYEWKNTVENLIDLLPNVVLDTRTNSPSVAKEVRFILADRERMLRTIFVTQHDGQAPIFETLGISPHQDGIRLASEAQLPAIFPWFRPRKHPDELGR
jgi:hypothetical protein